MSAHLPFPDRAADTAHSTHPREQTRGDNGPRLRRIIVVNAAAVCGYALIPLLNDWLNGRTNADFSLVLPFTLEFTRELLDALVTIWQPLMSLTFASLLFALLTVSLSRLAGNAPPGFRWLARLLGGITMWVAYLTLGSLAVAGSLMLLSYIAVLLTVVVVLLLLGFAWGALLLIRLLFAF